jgi:hypothetical protein
MTTWEYLILELPGFEAPTHVPGASAAVHALNEEGARAWEAVGMTRLADGRIAALLKRPRPRSKPTKGDAPGDVTRARSREREPSPPLTT